MRYVALEGIIKWHGGLSILESMYFYLLEKGLISEDGLITLPKEPYEK